MLGERLKLARKRAGLSLRALSERLEGKVSAQALSKYEREDMFPSSRVLLDLAKVLEMPLDYFMSPAQARLDGVEFRKRSSTSAKDRARVEAEVLQQVERYLQIESILDLDSLEWHNPFSEAGYRIETLEQAEEAADGLRGRWDLGTDPIPNLTQLLEDHGIKVLILQLPEGVDGLTCFVQRPDSDPVPVIVVNETKNLERRRLTLAHELGHRILDIDSPVDIEKASTRFAGAFLVNGDHLEEEVGHRRRAIGYREIIQLKRFYKVSASAMLIRLRDRGIISEGSVSYAFRTYARSWRRNEPEPLEQEPDEHGRYERARRFERLCYRALAEELISLSKASELLQRPTHEIEVGIKGPPAA